VVSFSTAPPTTEIYPLSLHDALPIFLDPLVEVRDVDVQPAGRVVFDPEVVAAASLLAQREPGGRRCGERAEVEADLVEARRAERSEEHTSELQSRENLVCRLLLEKKK